MAVPVAVKLERSLTRRLIEENASAPERAIAMDLGFPRRRALGRLLRAGVIREAQPGIYWLDPAAYADYRIVRRNRMRWVILFLSVLVAVLMVLGIVRL